MNARTWLGAVLALGLMGCSESDSDSDSDENATDDGPSGGGAPNAGPQGSPTEDEPNSTPDNPSSGDPRCSEGCEATLAANCPTGPASLEECVSDCEAFLSGACADDYEPFFACAEGEELSCNEMGIPVVEACSAEQAAFIACLTGG